MLSVHHQYNKLRRYRGQVVQLERELREHKEQASSAKNKYADWNTELQKKLRDFREEKKSWISEAATLRNTEKEAQVRVSTGFRLLTHLKHS
jgi:predicted  nucleic acid-binding Zn-ribbon protein